MSGAFKWIGSTGILVLGFWTDEHDELSTFHLWFLNNHTIFSQGIGYFGQGVKADGLRIDDLTAAKSHGHLDLVLFCQEFFDLADFKGEIVFFCLWPEFDLPGFDNGLLFLGFLLFFLQFVPEFIKIHNPANRWISLVGNLDQVKSLFLSCFQGSPGTDYSALCPV